MSRPAEQLAATVSELLKNGAEDIGEASDTPELDARVLLQTLLKKDHAWLIAHGGETIDADDAERYRRRIRRRARGEPVAYITGFREFWTAELAVTPDVLIPRPETELLVQRALARIPLSESVTVADLGTGSGAIGLSIAGERPLCSVVATDSSRAALKIAERNKGLLGLRNINFRRGDWFEPLGRERFPLIACNPPYVCASHYEAALSHEPEDALFSGANGLDALEIVITGAGNHLEPGGWLIVEHGRDQRQSVRSLFEQAEFADITTLEDYAGHPRVTEGRRPRKP